MEILHNQTQASAASSPTHEFSFTISLDSSSKPNPLTVDLTPADDIFFHGQLLPLPLHSSTNSLDDFTIPTRNPLVNECDKSRGHSFNSYEYKTNNGEFLSKERAKSKSFSLLRRRSKEAEDEEGEAQGEKHKKKPRYNMGNFLKRYIKFFSKERKDEIQLRKKSHSFSEKLSLKEGGRDLRGRRGEFSAPALMRNSPSNSGIHISDSKASLHHSNDSSMGELQAAIQAAIAHCKNSIVAADKDILS